MTLRRKEPLRSDPETTLAWKRRSRRNNRLKRGRGPGRNNDRREREWRRAYGSEERVRWVQRQPCVACGDRPCENAHVTTGGTGRKADADQIVPLCWEHHQEAHQFGHRTFEDRHELDLEEEARRTQERWEEHVGG